MKFENQIKIKLIQPCKLSDLQEKQLNILSKWIIKETKSFT